MSEQSMVELVQEALRARGVDDEVLAAGEFNPRGHTGGLFVGGLTGGEAGGALGRVGEDVGLAAGSVAGMRAADAASGLPGWIVVAVTETNVYGFAGRRNAINDLVFEVPRAGLAAKVHGRVNVRLLELIHSESGSKIELEGNRLPVTHSKDVIDALTG
jgi:hypothetical protein